jgi:hypothetical protein
MRKFIKSLRNFWTFRKVIWNFRWWDYTFTLDMMKVCLKEMSDNLETKGLEIDEPRLKKVAKMRRAIEIINNMKGIDHIETAEKELGELFIEPFEFKPSESHPDSFELVDNKTSEQKEHNKKVYDRAREIEEQEWAELWYIFKGQNNSEYDCEKQDWNDWFDGTGMRGCWD